VQTRRFITVALRTFDGLDLSEQYLADILAAVNNYISGFVQREAAWSRFASRARLSGDASFEFGRQYMLDGIAAHLATRTGK
jgi:hypothetical protein